jgi:hypothetical protein
MATHTHTHTHTKMAEDTNTHLCKKIFGVIAEEGERVQRGRWSFTNQCKQFVVGLTPEGRLLREEQMQEHSETPPVHAVAVAVPLIGEDLRCDVHVGT